MRQTNTKPTRTRQCWEFGQKTLGSEFISFLSIRTDKQATAEKSENCS